MSIAVFSFVFSIYPQKRFRNIEREEKKGGSVFMSRTFMGQKSMDNIVELIGTHHTLPFKMSCFLLEEEEEEKEK